MVTTDHDTSLLGISMAPSSLKVVPFCKFGSFSLTASTSWFCGFVAKAVPSPGNSLFKEYHYRRIYTIVSPKCTSKFSTQPQPQPRYRFKSFNLNLYVNFYATFCTIDSSLARRNSLLFGFLPCLTLQRHQTFFCKTKDTIHEY